MIETTRGGRSAVFVATLLTGLLGFAVATAEAAPKKRAETAKLTVDVSAQKFEVRGGDVFARGPVVAKVEKSDGMTETVTQDVNLRVKPTSNCRILDLSLAKLYLNLLGLEVRTSDINVKITGESKQVLGKLFCSLSEGLKLDKSVLARKSAESLNRELKGQPLRILQLRAPIRVQEQSGTESSAGRPATKKAEVPPPAPGSCEVLDLLLGPLKLNLLGLVVDLYGATPADPVQVLITADPNGGALGATFCELAGPQ